MFSSNPPLDPAGHSPRKRGEKPGGCGMTVLFKPDLDESGLAETLANLPTRRDEHWKWSDLRRAANDVEGVGTLVVSGVDGDNLVPEDGARIDLTTLASAGASAADVTLTVKAGRSVTMVERHAAEAGSLGNVHVKIEIEAGARLDRIIVMPDTSESVFIASSEIVLGEGATLNQTALDFGGKLNRCETHVTHPGAQTHVRLDGVYLLKSGRHADQTSIVRHTGPGGTLSQLTKGAVMSGGQGVFRGKIIVERAAQKTDARMTHRGLLLGDRAEIDAKPELEIYADDVQCAHGNALGAMDDEALFYMRQRGIPKLKARALLIESFLAEPLDGIADEGLRAELLALLRSRLESVS